MIQSMTALAFGVLAIAETEAGQLTLRLSCQRSQQSYSGRLALTLRNEGIDDTAVLSGTALSNGQHYLRNDSPPIQPRRRPNPPRPHMIGLVELPRVWEPEGEAAKARRRLGAEPLLVHESPASAAAVIARVTDPDELTAREHGYAHMSAVAYGRERGWYRIGLRGDRYGWLSPQEAGTFRSTETLLLEALTHVTEHWDGRIADAPARSAPTRRSPRPANESVDVLETRQVGHDLWLRIAILDPGHCAVVEPRVVAAGWVLAYAHSGDPTVWFHSRGC